jgi:hypothetical protein
LCLTGRHQADVTAAGAAGVVRALARGEMTAAGTWTAEQVIDPTPFFARLSAAGYAVEAKSPTAWPVAEAA